MAVPNHQDRVVESNGVSAVSEFGISTKDAAHIMTILRDTLYSDKVLAVLREYSANAWDSHRDAGIPDRPISVVMPTTMNPTLSIRDFGRGLSHDDVFEVFTKYGASTKRSSNNAVGMLGIGCKSGFAYADTFSVTSWHGGKKRCYVAVLDETEKGIINLLHEEDSDDETGVLIELAVQQTDILEFQRKGASLFQFFEPRPSINIDLPPPIDAIGLTHGYMAAGNGQWVALMGCIGYKVDLNQISGVSYAASTIGPYVSRLNGILKFGIGELQVSASREALKYSTVTKAKLVQKLEQLAEEFVSTTLSTINQSNLDSWNKRLRGRVLLEMRLPLPKDIKDKFSSEASLKPSPKSFVLSHSGSAVSSIDLHQDSRIVLMDDATRALSGYNLTYYDYLLRPVATAKLASCEKELGKLLKKWDITGIPIVKLSTLPWAAPQKKNGRGKFVNKKHSVRLFRFNPDVNNGAFYHPYSKYWEIITHKPGPTDVFVLISDFLEQEEGKVFFETYRRDKAVAELVHRAMPKIYGYKVTSKIPKPKTIGITYKEWQQQFRDSLFTEEIREYVALKQWSEILSSYRTYEDDVVAIMCARLGECHRITQIIQKRVEAAKLLTPLKSNRKLQMLVDYLARTESAALTRIPNRALEEYRSIMDRYPLLRIGGYADLHLNENQDEWLDYVQLVDNSLQEDTDGEADRVHTDE